MGCGASRGPSAAEASPTVPPPPLTVPPAPPGAGTASPKPPAGALAAPKGSDAPYSDFEALIASVESGAVAPLRGSWLIGLHERGGRLRRRQDLPPEAFWTASELRAILDTAKAHFGDEVAARAAVGHLFCALSYRWLAKGSPDPDGFHLEIVANFLYSYLGRPHPRCEGSQHMAGLYLQTTPLNSELFAPLGLSSPDCALFWDYGVLWQKALPDASGVQNDDRTSEQRARCACTCTYTHMEMLMHA